MQGLRVNQDICGPSVYPSPLLPGMETPKGWQELATMLHCLAVHISGQEHTKVYLGASTFSYLKGAVFYTSIVRFSTVYFG